MTAFTIRQAWRSLSRTPALTTCVVLLLALGVTTTTVAVSIVRQTLLQPVAIPDLSRLVAIRGTLPQLGLVDADLSPPEVVELAARKNLFNAVGGYSVSGITLTGFGEARRASAMLTVGDLFGALGARPAAGRFYSEADARHFEHPVAVISHSLWMQIGNGDQRFVGRTITLDGMPFEVIGVLPDNLSYPRGVDIAIPYPIDDQFDRSRGRQNMMTIGRLAMGVNRNKLSAGLALETGRWHTDYPALYANTGHALRAVPLAEQISGPIRGVTITLACAVALLLMTACANAAGLLLMRAVRRSRETGVRIALGATRRDLLGIALYELLIICVLSGTVALVLASLATSAIGRFPIALAVLPGGLRIDRALLATAGSIAILSTAAAYIAPTWFATRLAPHSILQGSSRGATSNRTQGRLLSSVMVGQVALTVVLLIGAGMFIQSLRSLLAVDLGFRPDDLQTMRIAVPRSRYREPTQLAGVIEQLVGRLKVEPGIRAVGVAAYLPLTGTGDSAPFEIVGEAERGLSPHAELQMATSGYFSAMQIPLRRGRLFDASERAGGPTVAVVDEAFAKEYFPGQDAVGRSLRSNGELVTIIGVVGDVVAQEIGRPAKATIYFAYAQRPFVATPMLVVGTKASATTTAEHVRTILQDLDPGIPVYDVQPMHDRIGTSLAPRALAAWVLAVLAGLALGIALFGIYGAVSHSFDERQREIAVRVAVGAGPRDIVMLAARWGGRPVSMGLAAGVLAALLAMRLARSLLFDGNAFNVPIFIIGILAISGVTILALALPSRRAMKIQPVEVLRAE